MWEGGGAVGERGVGGISDFFLQIDKESKSDFFFFFFFFFFMAWGGRGRG